MILNNFPWISIMTTKTLSASLDPGLYDRTQQTAREEGRKQSAVVAEALSFYTALPRDVRRLLRDLALTDTPELAAALATRLRAALLDVRWEQSIARIRAATEPAVLKRFEGMTDEEIDALADEAVRATRSGAAAPAPAQVVTRSPLSP